MKRDFAGAHLRPDEYQRLRAACRFDTTFPPTLEAWQKLVAEGDALATQAGESSHTIDVDVAEFERWCVSVQVRPSMPALRAFLIVKRHGVPGTLTGGRDGIRATHRPAAPEDDPMEFVGTIASFVRAALEIAPARNGSVPRLLGLSPA